MKIFTFLGLSTGNFLYQFTQDGNYHIAIERSFFMGVALLAVYLIEKVWNYYE